MADDETPKAKPHLASTLRRPEVLVGIAGVIVSYLIYRRMRAASGTAPAVVSTAGSGTGSAGGGIDTSGYGTIENQFAGLIQQFQTQQGQEQADQQANASLFSQLTSSLSDLSAKIASVGSQVPAASDVPTVASNPAPATTVSIASAPPPTYGPMPTLADQVYGHNFANIGENGHPWAPAPVAGGVTAPDGGVLAFGTWDNGVLTQGAYRMPDGSLVRERA